MKEESIKEPEHQSELKQIEKELKQIEKEIKFIKSRPN